MIRIRYLIWFFFNKKQRLFNIMFKSYSLWIFLSLGRKVFSNFTVFTYFVEMKKSTFLRQIVDLVKIIFWNEWNYIRSSECIVLRQHSFVIRSVKHSNVKTNPKIFFRIFYPSFRNSGSNGAIYNFFKPETNKGEFSLYFELFEKKF